MQEMKNEEYEKIIQKYGKDTFESFPKEKQEEIIKAESFLKPEDIIKYGSNPDKKYYYICPRYWCLKTNKPIDPKEMIEVTDKDGKKVKRHPTCGGIIPDEQTEIKNDGNYVYEFFDKQEHRSRDNYKQHYPGFLPSGKHPNGLCIPCCFAKWNTPGQIGRRKECAQKEEEKATFIDPDDEIILQQKLNSERIRKRAAEKRLKEEEQKALNDKKRAEEQKALNDKKELEKKALEKKALAEEKKQSKKKK